MGGAIFSAQAGNGRYIDNVAINSPDLGNGSMVANQAFLMKFRTPARIIVNAISLWCASSAGGGTVDAAIYRRTGATTFSKMSTESPVAVAVNELVVPFATPIELLPGVDYWAASSVSESTSTFSRGQVTITAAQAAVDDQLIVKAASHPLPATISAPTTHQNYFWNRVRGS